MVRRPSIRRSLLYVPGDRPEMLTRADQRGADVIILNLEDAVAVSNKDAARRNVIDLLGRADSGTTERVVRINSLHTDCGFRDLLEVVGSSPDAILLPKVESPEEVRFAAWAIGRLESTHMLPAGQTEIMCMVESATGVLAAPEIALAHPRVTGLVFGAADFSASVGCDITPDQRALLYAASRLVLAARLAGIHAIDAPHMTLGNSQGLQRSAEMTRELDFDGKSAIHPTQIPVINAVFAPQPEQIRWAKMVVETLTAEGDERHIRGAALLDNRLIEAPHLARAQRILETARLLGSDVLPEMNSDPERAADRSE